MKTTKYILLIICSLVFPILLSAQNTNSLPILKVESEFQSTSSMAYSGSTLPLAASTGVVVLEETVSKPSGPRRVGGWGDNNAGDPGAVPIGDAILPLLLLAVGYVAIVTRKKQIVKE